MMAGDLILYIEDDDKSRKLVRDILGFKGYRVAEAETGEDGVRLAKELLPALVLMDIRLPGINGIVALGRLREDPATHAIPVIAVTASAMPDDRHRVMSAGFDGYQRKPINVMEFLEAVRQMLDHRAASGEIP
jgi:CheY-like chemotaxis protein